MPGSGKSTVASIAPSLGFKVFSMGDIVRELAQERGIEPTPEKLGDLMLTIRKEKGPAIIAVKIIGKIRHDGSSRICIEGLRSLEEVDVLRSEFHDFVIVGVHSSPRTRFTRLTARERRDDPKTHENFWERDRREISVGLGDVLALADFAIVNEGSVEELKSTASRILQMVEISVQTRD
jgi:dephospho-CoA kinase